jgi:hypothetical protein
VYGFVGVAAGGDIVEKAVSRGEVVLGGVGLVGGKLADSSENRQVFSAGETRVDRVVGMEGSG